MRGKFEPIDIVEETTADLLESGTLVKKDSVDSNKVQVGTYIDYEAYPSLFKSAIDL